jgi:argininosuccinate synthase
MAARQTALLHAGEWMSDARAALDAFVAESQKRVTGAVRVRLRAGTCRVVRRTLSHAGTEGAVGRTERPAAAASDARAPVGSVTSH